MITAYLALGSNLNNPSGQLHHAIQNLQRLLPYTYVLKVAPFFSNPAMGRRIQPHFYNTVVKIHTRLSPQQLLKHCQNLEKKQGRQRKIRWGARTLDIDIILYGNQHIKTPTLIIPHPLYQERDFVTIPLSFIKD